MYRHGFEHDTFYSNKYRHPGDHYPLTEHVELDRE